MLVGNLRRRAVSLVGAAALFALVPLGVAEASKDHDDDKAQTVLRSPVAASQVSDPAVLGVLPGTTPWAITRGSVRLDVEGQLRVRVRGLIIPVAPAKPTNPVPTLSASVFCNGTLVASTSTVPFNTRGDAQLDTDIGELPSPCVAPAVLVHPNAVTGRYIAFNGSRR